MNVRIHRTEKEIESCKESWRAMQRHPNADWDFFALINRVRSQTPCVLELEEQGKTRALWVGRIEQSVMPLQIGYLKLGRMRVRQLNIINGGVMGEASEQGSRALLDAATRLMREEGLDFITLSYIPVDQPLFALCSKAYPSFLSRDWGVTPNEHWRMTLPASFEEFLKKRSKKHRYWLKRLPRVLEDDFPGQVRMRAFTKAEEALQFCSEAGAVAKLTYQHQLGSAFNDDAEYRERCQMLAAQGALRGYIFYVKDKPAAYWFVTAYQGVLHLNYTGYDPEFRRHEVGTVLLMKLFEDHCGGEVKKVDFGLGAALYKERFGDESFREAPVRIYNTGLRAQCVKIIAAMNAQVVARLKSLLTRLGLLQRLKTWWRARLTKKAAATTGDSEA